MPAGVQARARSRLATSKVAQVMTAILTTIQSKGDMVVPLKASQRRTRPDRAHACHDFDGGTAPHWRWSAASFGARAETTKRVPTGS
jgi:hypothetical protein